jgi:hypothetical protein
MNIVESARRIIINLLLRILNHHWINRTPCEYGHINGLGAMSYDALVSEDSQSPGITVRQVIEGIDRFMSCPMRTGLTVIDGDEEREATCWDIHDLRQSLTPNSIQEPKP